MFHFNLAHLASACRAGYIGYSADVSSLVND